MIDSLERVIEKNLGKSTIKKIQYRLFEKHGISLTQSIQEFEKIDEVLKEFFGSGAKGIEMKFLEEIFKDKSKYKENTKWIIKDEKISQMILESFRDDNKTLIINSVIDESKIISDILSENKIPQTSGYRKINQLIANGLINSDDTVIIDGKKIIKYRSLFDSVQIKIVKKKIMIEVELDKKNFNNSSIFRTIYN